MSVLKSNLEIGAEIGHGHFGSVCAGLDQIHGNVAVKIFTQAEQETSDKWLSRKDDLLREGENLKKASHRNVVQVHQLLEADAGNSIHLVMEFCAGGSLQGPYDRGPLSPRAVHRVATDIAVGLGALHARGMLHRDIKPGNILIDERGQAKLGDFGLVTDNLILGYGSQAGYSDHIAPEVWAGEGTSTRTDIWALGMTLYRLLHGRAWYESSPAPRIMVPDGNFASSLRWLPHVSAKWRRIIRQMLNDDPKLRHQSADGVLNDLANLALETDWECYPSHDDIRWSRKSPKRTIVVEWAVHSPRKHSWIAKSMPADGKAGRTITLAGSGAQISRSEAERQLVRFFATSR